MMMPLPGLVTIAIGSSVLGLLTLLRALHGLSIPGRLYDALAVVLIRRSRLFDEAFYRENNRDLAGTGCSPLLHYARIGDREGRCPSACFDPAYYRLQVASRLARSQALLHYLLLGRYRRRSPSAWFDSAFYLRENKDVARAGQEPLAHYLGIGARQGRSPSEAFDSRGYLEAYPDVRACELNPLLHFVTEGRFQGRRARFDQGAEPRGTGFDPDGCQHQDPQQHPQREWQGADGLIARLLALETGRAKRPDGQQALVDLVIPVYRGRLETLRCLLSVLRAKVEVAHEVIVINDASPDPVLSATLRRLDAAGLISLIEQPSNQGFVRTANLGLALHPERDVLLLNADTEVYDGWLDRLRRTALQQGRVGTVTPLSNNASICSYPRRGRDNPYPFELSDGQLDALAARVNQGLSIPAPTAVGFCMYLRRACLDEVGLFDAEAFSPGYGEENDFSQRAAILGWQHRIAADVFVRHWGARSFRGERGRYMQAAKARIAERYPGYRRQIQAFDAADPLAEARERLDWGRLTRQCRRENVLILHHRRGGGSARRVAAEVERLRRRGLGVFLLRPVPGDPWRLELQQPALLSLPNLPRVRLGDRESFARLLAALRITEVQTHGLFDLVPGAIVHLEHWVRSLGLRWVAYLHDYKAICPRVNLADRRGHYCGELGEAQCRRCLTLNGSEFGRPPIAAWRAMHGRALGAAASVCVPDEEVAQRIRRYLPDLALEVSAHEIADPAVARPWLTAPVPMRLPHVVVLGAIGRRKGFDVLLRCARAAHRQRLQLRFTLLGFSRDDRQLRAAGVEVSGRYPDAEALERLQRLAPDLLWLPSVCPETFSYTLSIALRTGLPVCAFDLGAIGARLRRLGISDGLTDLRLADRPAALNRFLVSLAAGKTTAGPAAALAG